MRLTLSVSDGFGGGGRRWGVASREENGASSDEFRVRSDTSVRSNDLQANRWQSSGRLDGPRLGVAVPADLETVGYEPAALRARVARVSLAATNWPLYDWTLKKS